ncbi:hypothetical protein L1A22_00695 [Pseudomonas extremaustralis]|uniref:hypothetical protein n=1 Tax=Pseudomonas extremaustralis TaxID=359110 RepID=UPI0021C78E41|nr:hypothetical protein [Pseudomonas extremaustralis]UUJ40873.1 hypothetical protein L1A22_00695 [Pseudomonas extremaustralis]
MADQIARLDAELVFLDQIAAELERQVGPSTVTRPLVIAWLSEWLKVAGESKPGLPHLPHSLKAAYAAWTHQAVDR